MEVFEFDRYVSCTFSQKDTDAQNVGVVHALIEKEDLDGRRIETWVRDFDEAKTLLDIYTGQRTVKHELFMPEYARIADGHRAFSEHLPSRDVHARPMIFS